MKGDLHIPAGVEKIEARAFSSCGFDGQIYFSEGIKQIDAYAFAYCEKLSGSLELPESLTLIGDSAFTGDKSVTALKLPSELTLIYNNTFSGCSSLTGELVLPEKLLVIGDLAFARTGFKGELVLPDTLVSLGNGCFSDCKNLDGLAPMPTSLKNIREGAFSSCSHLKGTLDINDELTYIGDSAFYGCESLEEVNLGECVRSIGPGAFAKCSSLEKVSFNSAPDYYTEEEKHPSFPENIVLPESEKSSFYESCEAKKKEIKEKPTEEPEESELFADEEVPYIWTSSLTGWEFYGAGENADIVLIFDGQTVKVMLNGRDFDEADYSADPYDYENKTIEIDDLFCGIGTLKHLTMIRDNYRDSQLSGEFIAPDGTVSEIIFHTGSEEYLYID